MRLFSLALCGLICLVWGVSQASATGFVTTSTNNGVLTINGDNSANRIEITSTRSGYLIKAGYSTLIDGQQSKVIPASGINTISIDLKNGQDVLNIHDMGVNQLVVLQSYHACSISITNCRIFEAFVVTGSGDDFVQVSNCDGDFLRIGDVASTFLLGLASPGADSMAIVQNSRITCADIQSTSVSVMDFAGSLRVGATNAVIHDVDSSEGDVNLNFDLAFGLQLPESSILITCENNSDVTDFDIRYVETDYLAITTTGSLLNDRVSENDYVRIINTNVGRFELVTGSGRDWVYASNMDISDNSLVDLGSDRDQDNYGYFYNIDAYKNIEFRGGDKNDFFRISGGNYDRDLIIETLDGNDRVQISTVFSEDYVEVDLSGGNDELKISRSTLKEVSVFGGRNYDTATKDLTTTIFELDIEGFENQNLTGFGW